MKISASWLGQYYDAGISTGEISRVLTNTGLEVGGVEEFDTISGGLRGLVIGKVLTCEKHPNADRLSVTTVDVGRETALHIVCGAPNVKAGQKVVVATVGTTLYPTEGEPFKIKKGKIRGEESNGMICAEDEIGMGVSHDGIMVLKANAKPGIPAAEYFQLQTDQILEIDLTPNRSDAISHIGVARDLLAALKAQGKVAAKEQLSWPDVSNFKPDEQEVPVSIEVKDKAACPRYCGLTIKGIKVGASPEWLQNRLRSIGLKPINNIVDITNYVLHETGQPLHAFDVSKITGNKVVVKKLPQDTVFTTLDGIERKLSKDDLMICNEKEGMCIAGVFGGISSGVTMDTTEVFIESAYFNPVSIRKTAKRHGLSTDASFRYERGGDPNIAEYALKRAALLIKELAGGKISPITDIYPSKIAPVRINFSFGNCDRLIGQKIDREEIREILHSLDFYIDTDNGETLGLSIPTYRVDVKREADVVEEVLRIYGYNRIALPESLRSAVTFSTESRLEKVHGLVASHLSAAGFTEIMSNSLTKKAYYQGREDQMVSILNPLSSELDVLRQSLLYGALEALLYNRNRKIGNVKFYEFGKAYQKTDNGYQENKRLMLMMSGRQHPENWNHASKTTDFYDLKKAVWRILDRIGLDRSRLNAVETTGDDFDFGMGYRYNEKEIIRFGKVSSSLLNRFDIDAEVFYADMNWDALAKLGMKRKEIVYQPVPKFPVVRRDLALLLDESVKFEAIEQIALQSEKKLLRSVHLFDVYQGKGLDAGKKSYAVSFLFGSDDKTLKDKQVDDAVKRIYQQLTKETGATLRQGEI